MIDHDHANNGADDDNEDDENNDDGDKDTTGLKLHQQKKKVLEDPKAVLIPP